MPGAIPAPLILDYAFGLIMAGDFEAPQTELKSWFTAAPVQFDLSTRLGSLTIKSSCQGIYSDGHRFHHSLDSIPLWIQLRDQVSEVVICCVCQHCIVKSSLQ